MRNQGLQDALNLQFTLKKADGNPSPAWATIASQANGTLAIGAERSIDLSFTPPDDTPEGVYELKLNVQGDNMPQQSLNVYVSLTQSGQGSMLFKASDIYTATVGKDGKLIPCLAGATVTVQNENVATVTRNLATDSLGEALFQNLPAGIYTFRGTADNHQTKGGRFQIKPGITFNQPVFLEYNLITVDWSVREITIEDRYEIILNATFETDVPAAVVVLQPSSVNLPKMNLGEMFFGELTLINFGLIRADHVRQQLPQSDAYFRYEFLVDVPSSLEAKQRSPFPPAWWPCNRWMPPPVVPRLRVAGVTATATPSATTMITCAPTRLSAAGPPAPAIAAAAIAPAPTAVAAADGAAGVLAAAVGVAEAPARRS